MLGFFSQFGHVTRLKISRNRMTNKPRSYAFIEFDSLQVASIVASTMHKYMIFGKTLVCKLLPRDKVHPRLFHKSPPFCDMRRNAISKRNKQRTPKQFQTAISTLIAKERKARRKLEQLGIEYDYPGYIGLVQPKPKHKFFSDD